MRQVSDCRMPHWDINPGSGFYPTAYRRSSHGGLFESDGGLTEQERRWLSLSQSERTWFQYGGKPPHQGQYQGWKPGVAKGGLPVFRRPSAKEIARAAKGLKTGNPALDVAQVLLEQAWEWYWRDTGNIQAAPGGHCWSCAGIRNEWTWFPLAACSPNICGIPGLGMPDTDHTQGTKRGLYIYEQTVPSTGQPGSIRGTIRELHWYPGTNAIANPEKVYEQVPRPAPVRDPWRDPRGRTWKRFRQAAWWLPETEPEPKGETDPPDRPEKPKPPDPGTKERKVMLFGLTGAPRKIIDAVTEALDLLECAWDALPSKYKTKPWEGSGREVEPERKFGKDGKLKKGRGGQHVITPQDKARDLWNNFDKMDTGKFFACAGLNHIEDMVIGMTGAEWARFAKRYGLHGFLIGPAM